MAVWRSGEALAGDFVSIASLFNAAAYVSAG